MSRMIHTRCLSRHPSVSGKCHHIKANQSRSRRQMFSSQQESGSRAQGLKRGSWSRIPAPFSRKSRGIPHPANRIFFFFFFNRFPKFLFCLWVFSEKAARLLSRLHRLGRFRQGVIRNLLPLWEALCSCWITHEMMFEIFYNKWLVSCG